MIRFALTALALLALLPAVASAQTYPSRPVKIISPFPPGGGTDLVARTVGQSLADRNKWQVVIENKAGAGGAIGLGEAKKAEPNGYELVVGQMDNLILAPWLSRVSFDSVKDFTPIALIGKSPIVLVTGKASRFATFGDAVAAVKGEPASVTLGSAGNGTLAHLLIELMRTRTDTRFRHVPYRGSTPAMTDLLGGHLDIGGVSIASALPLIRSGEVRALAVSSRGRNPSLPDVPSLVELGLKDVEVSTWYGLLGPAGLPADLTQLLNREVNAIVQAPGVAATLAEQGLESGPNSPEQFGGLIRDEYAAWQTIIADLGFKRE